MEKEAEKVLAKGTHLAEVHMSGIYLFTLLRIVKMVICCH